MAPGVFVQTPDEFATYMRKLAREKAEEEARIRAEGKPEPKVRSLMELAGWTVMKTPKQTFVKDAPKQCVPEYPALRVSQPEPTESPSIYDQWRAERTIRCANSTNLIKFKLIKIK